MDTDRNLLFGVLALQADLIDPSRFVEACTLWANHKQTPLADLLLQRGWLSAEERGHVDFLLNRKLEKHGGDSRACLTAVTTDQVKQSLAGLVDADVRESLGGTPPPPAGHVLLATTAYIPESRDRYTLSRLHATGGIGRVWLARDSSLARDVALKELRPERASNPAVWARFLKEAQITGQLEHPGIVPIYEVSRHREDQAPFYTMRFVRGRTLSEAIDSYHRKRAEGKARPLELHELLGAFVGVCNAVAYAHSRGVLHRDLKPKNVALGDYGEVIVLDWGLARLVDQAEEEAMPLQVTSESEGSATIQGQVLGTPAYMAPEQAEGRLDQLGPATDVYGLGAILYKILTGQPPFPGSDTTTVLRQVVHEPPAAPRSLAPGAPFALEAVCLKALAKRPAERYGSAKELAAEVQRFLADEPVTAYREPFAARAGRWMKRHKPLVAGIGVLMAAAVLGAAAIAWQADQARRRIEIEQVRTDEARKEAVANFHKALDAVEQMLTRVGGQRLAHVPLMEQVRQELLEDALRFYLESFKDRGGEPEVRLRTARSHRHVGDISEHLGKHDLAREHYLSALEILEDRESPLSQTASYRHERADATIGLAWMYFRIDRPQEAVAAFGKALSMLDELATIQSATAADRLRRARVHSGLVSAYRKLGRPADSERAYRAARPLLEQLVEEYPRRNDYRARLAELHLRWADLLSSRRQYDEAELVFRRAARMQQTLEKSSPEEPGYRHNRATTLLRLGGMLGLAGRFREGETALKEARDVFARLTAEFPSIPAYRSNYAATYHHLGELLQVAGRLPEATKAFEESLAINAPLVRRSPQVAQYQSDQAGSTMARANVLSLQGRLAEAEEGLDHAADLYARLVKDNPAVPQFRVKLSAVYHNRAEVLERLSRYPESLAGFTKAQRVMAEVPQAVRNLPSNRYDQANTAMQLGNLLKRMRRYDEAEQTMRQAGTLYDQLVTAVPDDPRYDVQRAAARHNLGTLFQKQGRMTEAESMYRQTLVMSRVVIARYPEFPYARADLANTLFTLAELLQSKAPTPEVDRLMEQAESQWEKLVTRYPAFPRNHSSLERTRGLRRLWQGRHAEAARSAAKLAKFAWSGRIDCYNAACLLALCIPVAEKDNHLAADQRKAQAEQYRQESLRMLRELAKTGELSAEQMKTDPDFKALHSDREFQKLRGELEVKQKAKKP